MEFGWLNNRQVAWFFALENPAGINADLAINIGDAYAVGHQAAGCGKLAKCIACWNRMTQRQCRKLPRLAGEECIDADEQCADVLLNESRKGLFEVALGGGFHNKQ